MALEGLHHVTAITADAPRKFHSEYFREPSGVLIEFASRDVGFDIDEPRESLGQGLMLPPQHESRREELLQALTPICNPREAT